MDRLKKRKDLMRLFGKIFLLAAGIAVLYRPGVQAQYAEDASRYFPGQVGINAPGGSPPVGSQGLPAIANALLMESQQAVDNLRYELAGTDVAIQGEIRAAALINACRQFQNNLRTDDARVLQRSFIAIDRAFTAFSQMLSPYGQDAPRTATSLDRIQRLCFHARSMIGSYQPGSPGLPVNTPPAFNSRAMADATARLQISIDQLSSSLGRYYQQEYGAARDAANQMEGLNRFLQGMLTSSVRNDEIWQATQQLRLASWELFAFAAQYP